MSESVRKRKENKKNTVGSGGIFVVQSLLPDLALGKDCTNFAPLCRDEGGNMATPEGYSFFWEGTS